MKRFRKLGLLFFLAALLISTSLVAKEEKKKDTRPETQCHLKFSLSSWSAFYKSGKGNGTITCDNGQRSNVKIRAHGGGVTFGKSKIVDGNGTFSKVHDIHELYGGYAESEAHAGASKSAGAHAMWNGDISLTLSGTGEGWDLGFAFGKFKISPK